MSTLEIRDLQVSIDTDAGKKPILKGVDLTINSGEIHAVMGPNGSGKSTLAYTTAGHPRYNVDGGSITFDGEDVLAMSVDERARVGLFLAMQYPVEIPGVTVSNFLRTAKTAIDGEAPAIRGWTTTVRESMKNLRMDGDFAARNVNEGFSGGEKKRHECSTRPTRVSMSTRSRSSPRVSTALTTTPASASCSSLTTRGSCATSSRTSCTSSSTARSPKRAAPSSPSGSRTRATTATSSRPDPVTLGVSPTNRVA